MTATPQFSGNVPGQSPGNPTISPDSRPPISPIGFLVRVIVVALLFVAGLAILIQGVTPPPRPPLAGLADARLADGTWVSVVAVTTGRKHEWQPPWKRTWQDWFRNRRRPGHPNLTLNNPEMLIWVVRHDGKSERPLDWPDLRHARVDVAGESLYPEDVRVFRSDRGSESYNFSSSSNAPFNPASYGGNMNGAAYLYVIPLPLPPAGCGPLSLTLLGDRPADKSPRPELVTLSLPEPGGLNPNPGWTASPLPASSTVGPYTLTITALDPSGSSYSSNDEFSNRVHFGIRTELTVDGTPSPSRIVEHGPLTDSAGNVQARGYNHGARLHFPPHKFTLTVQVPTPESLKASSRGTISGLTIPPDNTRLPESKQAVLRDGRIRLKTVAIGGRGKVVHPDPTPTSTVQWGHFGSLGYGPRNVSMNFEARRGVDHSASGKPGPITLTMDSRLVHVLYEVEGVQPRETLIASSVRDSQSRDVKYQDFFNSGTRMVILNPAEDATSFQVEWEIQDTEVFEFITDRPSTEKK